MSCIDDWEVRSRVSYMLLGLGDSCWFRDGFLVSDFEVVGVFAIVFTLLAC